jgi:hypothetical protein
MEKNIGKIDRRIRVLIGALIVVIGAQAGSIWGILGMIPIIISEIGISPLYALFHISTIQKQKKSR